MNEVIRTLISRRSVKKYLPELPPVEFIQQIAEAGSFAANGMGRQSPKILVITNKQLRDRLSAINAKVMGKEGIDPFYGAPAVIVVLADKSVGTYLYDGSLVMGNMMNAAHSLGIASCWIHRAKQTFESDEGKTILKELGIEGDLEGIGNLVIGYADGDPKPAAPRKSDYIQYIE